VLFDAGGVLIGPVGGRWNPRFDFEDVVVAHHPFVDAGLFASAIVEGQRVLDAGPGTVARDDYHRAMLRVLGVAEASDALLRELDAPLAVPAVEVLPGVRPVLDLLRDRGVRMSVVSDAWAGLDDVFRGLGIADHFAGFAISEVLGCRKPDPRMYAAGSDLLGLVPGDCLFVDDDPALVAAAVALGYHGVALVPDPAAIPAPGTVRVIASLAELPPIVAGA
jgi:putative hydrolase of the HAD superfamily